MAFEDIKICRSIPVNLSLEELNIIDKEFRDNDIYLDMHLSDNSIELEQIYDHVDATMLDGSFLKRFVDKFKHPFKTYYMVNEPEWTLNCIVFDGEKLFLCQYTDLENALELDDEDPDFDDIIENANIDAAEGIYDESKFPTDIDYFTEL
jgi:hypothetical protein